MTFIDRIIISKDSIRVMQTENFADALQFRRVNLMKSNQEIQTVPFQNLAYEERIYFQSSYETVELKAGDEHFIVDRGMVNEGKEFTKFYINLRCAKASSGINGYEIRLHLGNNAKLNASHIWIEDRVGTKYYFSGNRCLTNDQQSWYVSESKSNADLRLDAYARAVFEINR